MTTRFKLVVVDDHPLVRRGIVESLSEDQAFHVVGEGAHTEDAVDLSRSLRPHLIFLDVNMPGGGGVVAATRIRADEPLVKIAMFSFRQDLVIVRACFTAGASGYIVKGVSGSELVAMSHKILAGETVVDPEIARRLSLDGSS